jgi:hypothetical protein
VSEPWTEAAAEERWLEDLELGETARLLVVKRLAEEPVGGDAREHAYRDASARWLERGQPQVALALLDRSGSAQPLASFAVSDPRAEAPVDLLMARLPGVGGLPALTEQEAKAFAAADSPEDALAILSNARARLDAHAGEARRLLKRWVDRQ